MPSPPKRARGRRRGARGGGERLREAQAELSDRAETLRAARREAAGALAEAVIVRLSALAMEGASFEARVAQRDGSARPAATRSSS